jgi:hypothetical protein
MVVTDDGPGMAPDVAEHAFERFFRPEPGRTRGSGIGLGLAIVEAIATSHRGSVVLETAPGSGTRFTVRLPSATQPERAAANAQPILRFAGGSPEAGTAGSLLDEPGIDAKEGSQCPPTEERVPRPGADGS